MVRMSDIFKHRNGSDKDHNKPKPQDKVKSPQESSTKQINTSMPNRTTRDPDFKPIGLTDIIQQKEEIPNLPREETYNKCSDAYRKCIDMVKKAQKDIVSGKKLAISEFLDVINLIQGLLDDGKDIFIELAYCTDSREDYLSYHIVNSMIFSLVIAGPFEYNNEQLNLLGLAALTYDLGMVESLELAQQPRKLTTEELERIKNHINKSIGIFKSSGYEDIDNQITDTILQDHERMDGSGYPDGIKGSKINDMARIIGLVDTFEALTHGRAWRPRMLAFDAVKEILGNKSCYDQKALKSLLDNITIYPSGSAVLLNTEESAKVVKIQPGYPLRPVVKIWYDRQGNLYEDKKTVNLNKNTTIYIKKALDIK